MGNLELIEAFIPLMFMVYFIIFFLKVVKSKDLASEYSVIVGGYKEESKESRKRYLYFWLGVLALIISIFLIFNYFTHDINAFNLAMAIAILVFRFIFFNVTFVIARIVILYTMYEIKNKVTTKNNDSQ